MPDLAISAAAARDVNVITPRIGITPGSLAVGGADTANVADNARQASMTQQLFNTKYDESNEYASTRMAKLLGASAVDTADMVASAFPGVDRGQVWQGARNLGLNGLANFRDKNPDAVGLTSGIVGSIVTAGVADAYLAPFLAERLAASTFLNQSALWQWGARTLGGAKTFAIESALGAAVNGEAATVLGTTGGRALLRLRIAEGVGRGVVQEGAVAAVTHTNTSLWSDNMSTNLAMSALGIGVAGGLGALGARYEMRAIANSDDVMRTRASASDPYGWTAVRGLQPDQADVKALGAGAEFKESVNTTALMLQARQEVPAGVTGKRAQLIDNEAKQTQIQANESLQKITVKGIDGVPNTAFSLGDVNAGLAKQHIQSALYDDPTALLGFDSVGTGNFGSNVKTRNAYIAKLKDSDQVSDLRMARALEDQQPNILINKTWMPDSPQARQVGDYAPQPVILTPTSSGKGSFEYKMGLANGKKITINESGDVPNFGKMLITDQLQVAQGLNDLSKRMIAADTTYVVPKNPSWIQTDFAANFQKIGGTVDFGSQAGFNSMDEVVMSGFRSKANAVLDFARKNEFDFWARMKLNLPLPSSLERIHSGNGDSLVQTIAAALKNPDLTMAEAQEIRTTMLGAMDLRSGIKSEPASLTGDLFNFNRTDDGKWMPTLTGYNSFTRVTPEMQGSFNHLIVASAENKVFRMSKLQDGILTSQITNGLLAAPEFQSSVNITGLASDQVTGLGGDLTQGIGTMLTREMRYRDSNVMLSSLKVREGVNRAVENYTTQFMKSTFGGLQNELASVPNRASKALVDSWYSFAGGWDLKSEPVDLGGGMFGFALSDTPKNRARLGSGTTIDASTLLSNPNTGKPLAVDAKGLGFIGQAQAGYQALLKDTNAVRISRGLSPINQKAWYVPPPNTKGKIIGFTIGADGQAVPGGAVVANSQTEFEALRSAREKTLGPGQRFYSQAEIESTADLWDHAEMGWTDPGFIGAKKETQTGSIFGSVMNPRAMEDSLEWMTDRIKDIGNGTVRSLYDQQLGIARARSAAESAVAGGNNKRTIYDEWEATIMGRPLSSVKSGEGTKVIKAVEGLAQSAINSGWPLAKAIGSTQLGVWVNDLTQKMGMKSVRGFKSFDDLAGQLGDYTPYANAMDFATQNLRVSTPPEFKNIAAGINKLSASLLLRWFEIPNAAMNMLGIITNMPSILRSPSTPLIGELVSQTGKKIGVVDSYQIMARGFKDMLDGSKHSEWATMVKNGDTTQSIAELNKQLSVVDSKTAWQRVLGGDPNVGYEHRLPKSVGDIPAFVKTKGVDGLISLATDTTESMSRAWAHFIGLRLADANGVVGSEARHSFARQVANQAIANYNPLNKPELFQSSIGSMMGLFTSYMQQYNQRLFRWAETGDYRSIGRQLATQTALFGVASNPGYNALDWLFSGQGANPNATVTDMIYAKFGPKVGSIVANGGIQDIPRLFGLDTGVALYSRGDANVRSPSLDPTKMMAGLNTLSGIGNMMWEIGNKAFDTDSGVNMRYVSESIARNMPNRAMKGFLSVAANGGQDVDASGQIVSDTQNMLESGIRMLGLRSTRQQGEIEAYYANASQRRQLAGRMESLRDQVRADLRSGSVVDPMKYFKTYVDRGGSPTHFSTWIQDQMRTQTTTRGMNDMQKSLRAPDTQLEAWRYQMRQ